VALADADGDAVGDAEADYATCGFRGESSSKF